MRFLMIDEIQEWQSKTRITGIKNVTMSEDYLEFHFPGSPVMPGVLLLESLVQLAGWHAAYLSEFEDWVLLNKVVRCSFYGFALPGDQVRLELQIPSAGRNLCRGTGQVQGQKKITAEFETQNIKFQRLEDITEQKRFFQVLTRQTRIG